MGKFLLTFIFLLAGLGPVFGEVVEDEIFSDDFEFGSDCAWSNSQISECWCAAAGGPCFAPDTCCTSGCTNLQIDPLNCGLCDQVCGGSSTCEAGICVYECDPPCTSGSMPGCCSTGCTDMFIDSMNCGACDVVCPSGLCLAGSCF